MQDYIISPVFISNILEGIWKNSDFWRFLVKNIWNCWASAHSSWPNWAQLGPVTRKEKSMRRNKNYIFRESMCFSAARLYSILLCWELRGSTWNFKHFLDKIIHMIKKEFECNPDNDFFHLWLLQVKTRNVPCLYFLISSNLLQFLFAFQLLKHQLKHFLTFWMWSNTNWGIALPFPWLN